MEHICLEVVYKDKTVLFVLPLAENTAHTKVVPDRPHPAVLQALPEHIVCSVFACSQDFYFLVSGFSKSQKSFRGCTGLLTIM